MANKKIQATATLFLDTKDAQSDAKKFVNDLKQKLSEVETAADKMTVFKDMVAYIAQVDRALAALRKNNQDAFNSMFDGLDINLKQQLEGLFGVNGAQLGQVDALREKLNTLTLKSSIKEIRTFAKEINALFTSIGVSAPFDNINEQFSGRTNTGHIQALATSLANFATVWEDLSARVSQGFGGAGGSGSGVFGGLNNEVQEEIDKLKKQKEDITSIVNQIKEVSKMSSAWEDGDAINLDFEATEEAAQKLIDRFKQLDDAINNNEFDDKSVAYADALTERAKIALQLIELNNRLIKTDVDGGVAKNSPSFLRNFLADNEDGDNIVNYAIEDFVNETEDLLENLQEESANTIQQINELKKSINDTFSADGGKPSGSNTFEIIGDAAEDAGDKVDTFSKKVDNLNESIKRVYMSALDLEVDTRNGNANGKEFMNLFGADGIVSTTQGVDYQVDTDTLVQQLVANLNRDIVMSLHNHANGDISFSPSDINSFAKMYYGQGTKINGIIANGFIHTIDFNSIGQEVAIQIAQDYQDGIQHLFEAKNIAQFASFENGSIVPSDLLKQVQTSNPEYYQEVIDQLQEAQMIVLRQAFEKNGAEFTLQSFGLDNIDELSTYLTNVQKNTQNTIEPVEKLKNLISTLRPSADLSEFTEVFDKFKNGAIDGSQALNQVLDLAPNNISDKAIDETNQKLREQEQLYQNLRSAIKGTFSDIVDVDDMTYAFDTLEKEIEAGLLTTLDQCIERFKLLTGLDDKRLTSIGDDQRVADSWDYYQGNRYVSSDETVIDSSEYNQLREDLADEQDRANKYAGDAAVAEDRANKAEARAAEAEARVDGLREQLSTQTDADHKSQLAQAEVTQLELLQQKLLEVKTAVDAKTQAFEEEYATVDGVVDAEITSLQSLITQLQEVVAQINLINDGFNNINTNAPKIELKSTPVEQSGLTENIHYVTDPQGRPVTMYRGIRNSYSGLVSNRYHGGTFSTDNLELAKEYAGELGKVEKVLLSMKNPLEIDGHCAFWNQIEYIGDNSDEASQKLYELNASIRATKKLLADAENIPVSDQESKNILRGFITEEDTKRAKEISYWTKELKKHQEEKAAILADTSNPYGKKNTNELVEIAKAKGYDGVIFKNIIDSATGDVKDLSNVMVTFEQDQIHYIETIASTFESSITELKNHFGGLTKHISASGDEVEASIRKMVELRGKLNAGEISEDEYNAFISGNAIARDYKKLAKKSMAVPDFITGALDGDEFELKHVIQMINDMLDNMRHRVQKVAKAFGKEGMPLDQLLVDNTNVAPITESSADEENVVDEVEQLNKLQTVLTEVKNAVLAKTKAFVDEGDVVGQVVGKEVSALMKLAEIVDSIVPKVDLLSTKMAGIGPIDFVAKNDSGTTESDTTAEDKFQTRVNSKKSAMTKYINDLKDVQYITDDTRDELIGLRDALDTVKTPKDLNDIIAKFEKLQTEISILKTSFEKTGLNDIQNVERSLLGSFNTLDIGQKRELEPERDAVIKQLETYKNAVLNGQKVELQAIEDTVRALREKIEVYKQANKEANNAKTAQKKNSKFGDTVSRNATAKYNSLMGSANSDQFANSKEVAAIVEDYEKAYKSMIAFRNELRNSDSAVSEADEVEFKRLTTECNEYAKALDKLIKSTMKLKGNKANPNDYMLGSDFADNAQGRKQALTDFVKSVYDIDVAAEDFKKDWNEVIFAVDNGDGTFTQMTARFTDARNEIVALAGDTNKVQGKFESFIDGVKNRLQSLSQYFIATVGIYDVWNVVKQGINHVREIDTALTELKKVTDETDASYAQFLQDMAKTGSVIGATVKDLTTMAAEWGRLGYSLEEAGKLAESTGILLNVSEFDDATSASEALISTMQAFQYTADESGHVVDILNEIGNNYAVSSDGLAIALQDSASALMEGGNNLEQAVALVAAANRVVQDPNSVGSALRTISLRLRGTSVEVLEEMGEETDGVVESISKLQEKLKALTGVDIVDMNGAYKDTYTILKEIGSVWKDLDPMDQAAALELMAGKNRANTLAAILNNMKDLDGAYNDALKAEGSALKENQAYLDSIQGRIDLFNNAVQTMWMNLIDSSVVKGVVDIGTVFIKFLDSGAGKVAALSAAIAVLGKVLKANAFSSVNGELQIFGKTIDTIRNNFTKLSAESTGVFGKLKAGLASVFTDGNKIDISKILSQDTFDNELTKAIDIFKSQGQVIDEVNWGKYVDGVSQADAAMGAALKTCKIQNGTIIAGSNAYQAYTGAATGAAVGTSAVGGAAQKTTGQLIAMKVAALAANAALTLGLSLLVSLAVQGISAWANAGEAARKAAQDAVDASEELREQNESLKDYKDQINELRVELDSNTLSEQEAYDAREKLLTIQNELIDKFGLEKDGINLVTGAIEDQIAAIDALSQKDAQQWLNNNQKSINEAIAFFDNSAQGGSLDDELFGLDKKTTVTNWGSTKTVSDMISDYAKDRQNINTSTINGVGQDINFTGSVEEVKQEVEDFQDWLGEKEREMQSELSGLTSLPASEQTSDVKNKINSLKADIAQLQDVREDIGTEYLNWFGENSTYAANKALLEETQYNTAITKYADQYGDILDAQTKLEEAQAKGDKDGIKSALATINEETTAAAVAAEKNGESYMASFFNGIQSEYAKLSNEIKLETDLFENILFGDSGKNIQDVLSEALSGLEGMNAKEILQLGDIDPNNTAFISLNQIAQAYGMTIEELCNALVKLKYIQSGFVAEAEAEAMPVKTYSELTEEVESYNDVLSQTSEIVSDNTEVTQEYKDALKALGVSEEELNECFDENNGLIVKNAAALRRLVAQKKKDKQAIVQQAKAMGQLQYKKTVQQLQQVVKAMAVEVRASGLVSSAALRTAASLREQLDALKQTIQQYALLEISLSDAANAYSEFEAAKERDAQLTYGDSMIEMLQTINEGFKTGQVGTEAFQFAVEAIVPPEFYQDIDDVEARMIAIHDYIDKNPLFADWFTIDEGEFSITLDNINAFIDDAYAAGLFTSDSSGDFFLTGAATSLEAFAEQLGVTESVALAMLTELEKYDASWGNILTDLTTTPLDRAINDATDALEEAITAQEEFITSGGDLNSDKYIELEEAVSAARGALDNASQAAINNAQAHAQVEAVLKGMTGEVKYTQEQADALARSLGLINENGHIQIDTDTGALLLTKEQVAALNKSLKGLTEPTILDVQLAYDEIDRQLQELNAYLSDPSNYSGTILTELSIANEGEAKAKVDELTADRDAIELVYNITTTSTEESGTFEKLTTWEANGVQIVISGDASAFDSTVSATNAVEMDGKTVPIDADPTEANASMDVVDNREMEDKEPGIYMQGVSVALNDIYSIDNALDALPIVKDVYVNVHYSEDGAVEVNGTAHVNGTAYSNGNWGAPRTEVALTGELGPEMVVRDGRWFTVGENGAEFTQIKKGDIIFNHKQTEDLLSKGYVTSRGKAYASGTIPNANSGTAYYKTFGGYVGDNDVFENGSANWMDPWTNSFGDVADSLSGAADSLSDAADDSEQTVDFIEMKLEEIEAIIEKTTSRIENFLDDTTDVKSKDELYDELVKAERDKSETYLKAAQKYDVQAAAALSGVPQQYQEMARNGAIAIEEFLGENQVEIAEKIEKYRDLASKADEAENGHLEAIAAISSHRVEQLEDIATDFENIISISKSHSDLLQAEMDFIEESGNRLSESYYEELKKYSQRQLDDMQNERVALQKILDDAVAAGDVIIGTDDWYSMLETIYEVDQEIVECKTNLEEFQNAINDLYWDNFDKLITEIDNVNSELSNLYGLISDDDKIVDDMGNWTADGYTALGLLIQQMEAAQQKSEEYGDAISKLKKDYKDGLYSTDEYNEKLAELTDGQYDAIKSYEDTKDAIIDLNKTRIEAVKRGIEKEIDAYEELISKKKESLDADKDARDFERSVEESNKSISDVERKIASLKGDTSSSAIAERRRLEEELRKLQQEREDLFYDESVENQKEGLDKELENFKDAKNKEIEDFEEYLKNQEKVLQDSFTIVQENTQQIAGKLVEIAEDYGVTISDTVATPWINGANAIGTYEEQLNTSVSATTKNLETLKQQLKDLETQADKTANSVINSTQTSIVTANDGYQTSIKGYAKGTTRVPKSGLYNLDELGPELVLHAGKNGKIKYLTMDSAVVPADLTQKLMQWGQLDPSQVLERSASKIGAPNIATINNNMEINLQVAEVVHIDHADNDSIPDIAKAVKTQMDNYMRDINNKLRRK